METNSESWIAMNGFITDLKSFFHVEPSTLCFLGVLKPHSLFCYGCAWCGLPSTSFSLRSGGDLKWSSLTASYTLRSRCVRRITDNYIKKNNKTRTLIFYFLLNFNVHILSGGLMQHVIYWKIISIERFM